LKVVTVFGVVTNRQILTAISLLAARMDILMTDQDQVNAAAQQIEADVAAENTALTAIEAEIAALKAGNPAIDFTGLNQAVADLGTATAAEQAVVPPPAG
jgi:cell division protein FtsB